MFDEAKDDILTAHHESGHAWVTYWNFVRKDWCRSLELTIDEESPGDALGFCMSRGLRVPEPFIWAHHTQTFVAGPIAEGLYAIQSGYPTKPDGQPRWTSSEQWKQHCMEKAEWEIRDLTKHGSEEDEGSGDIVDWFQMGQRFDCEVTFDIWKKGWGSASHLVLDNWSKIEQLAQSLLEKRRLSHDAIVSICEA